MKIYLVLAETGEHDLSGYWVAKAFQDKERAEEWAKKAQIKARKLNHIYWKNGIRFSNDIDPKFEQDGDYIEYKVEEIEVE
jgi:hypothetical protein